MKKPVIIGIAGGSASGKTSIAQELYDCFKGRHTIRIIKLDDYYKDQTPVSYTHLLKMKPLIVVLWRCLMRSMATVSYTHLDQVRESGSS